MIPLPSLCILPLVAEGKLSEHLCTRIPPGMVSGPCMKICAGDKGEADVVGLARMTAREMICSARTGCLSIDFLAVDPNRVV